MRADGLLDEIYHSTVGLPREERLVAALRVLHGAALESSYPSSGAWVSRLADLIDVAHEGERARDRADAEYEARQERPFIEETIREITDDLTDQCIGSLAYLKEADEGVAFIIAVDEDADRLTRYIKRYWGRT